jgi:hypothetical protein
MHQTSLELLTHQVTINLQVLSAVMKHKDYAQYAKHFHYHRTTQVAWMHGDTYLSTSIEAITIHKLQNRAHDTQLQWMSKQW